MALFSQKRECNTDMCFNMNEPWKHAKKKKPSLYHPILSDDPKWLNTIYKRFWTNSSKLLLKVNWTLTTGIELQWRSLSILSCSFVSLLLRMTRRNFTPCPWSVDIIVTLWFLCFWNPCGMGGKEAGVWDCGILETVQICCVVPCYCCWGKADDLNRLWDMDPIEVCSVLTPSSKPTLQGWEKMRSACSSSQQWHLVDQLWPFFIHKAPED